MIDEKLLLESFRKCYSGHVGMENSDSMMMFKSICRVINEQPKVENWIPCNKTLPNESFEDLEWSWADSGDSGKGCSVLVTIDNYPNTHRSNPHVRETIFYKGYNDFNEDDVIAWMPLSVYSRLL